MGFFEWVGNAIFGTFTAKLQHFTTKQAKLTLTSTTDRNVPFRKDAADFVSYEMSGAEQIRRTEIDQTLARHSPITPEQAAADFPTLFAGALGVVNAFDIAGLITECASIGLIDKAIPEMKATIMKSTGAEKILGVIANMEIKCGSEIPLNYYFLKKHRPMIPPMGDCVEALSRYLINPFDFDQIACYHGFTGTYLSWYKEFSKTPLRYFALAAVARSGLYDESFFEEELRRAGYAPDSKEKLKTMYKSLAVESELAGAKSIASKAYREGIIDRATFHDYLIQSGLDPSLVDLTLQTEDLRTQTDARDLSTSVHTKLFTTGIINESEYRSRLVELGYTTSAIDDLVNINLLKKQEDPKLLSLSQLNDAIKYDLIDEKYYYDKTKDLGYPRENAELLLNTLRAKQTKTPQEEHRDLSLSQITKMLKIGQLDLNEYRQRLELMGYNAEDVDLLVTQAEYEITQPEGDVWKPIPRATVIDLYMNGVIDYDDYLSRMELLRYTEKDAELFIILEYSKEAS